MKFNDDVLKMSGWIHDFYCDNDGSELLFDLENSDYFWCPICHHKYSDEKRKRAWVIKYRYKIFEELENLAEKYTYDKRQEYLDYVQEVLNFYALNYSKFVIHNKKGEVFFDIINNDRCGRITSQGLNEAMISIRMVNALMFVYDDLSIEIRQNVNLMFKQIFELLKPQISRIHNIDFYIICAIGMMGIISENKEMMDFAFNSRYSFYNQLGDGLTKDCFWFEGSIHYHFFILEPILELLRLARNYNYELLILYDKVKMMVKNGFQVSFNDTALPSPNDGWPNRYLDNYLNVFRLARQVFREEFMEIIENIKRKKVKSVSKHYFDTGFSMLKNDRWEVFIKYGDNNLNHAHPDKLNVEIKYNNSFLTHDLSTAGYGSKISKEYYKKSYAHNTICVGGVNQNMDCKSEIITYDDNMIEVKVYNIYEKVDARRKIVINSLGISDTLIVENKNGSFVDYIFYSDVVLISDVDGDRFSLEGYPYIINIRKIKKLENDIKLNWKLDSSILTSTINLVDKELFIGEAPDNPSNKNRTVLIIRSNDKDPIYKIEWEAN